MWVTVTRRKNRSQNWKFWPWVIVYLSQGSINKGSAKKTPTAVTYWPHTCIQPDLRALFILQPETSFFVQSYRQRVLHKNASWKRGPSFSHVQFFNNPSSSILQTCTYLPHFATTQHSTVRLTSLCTACGSCWKHFRCKQPPLPRE